MNYRHGYHAGNFADVHKHVALLTLIAALQRKEKGFLYVDTHAGRGWYDLHSPEAQRSGEARAGIERLLHAAPRAVANADAAASTSSSATASDGAPSALQTCLDAVARLRRERDDKHGYPGSPLLAAAALRPQDRAACFEAQPSECRGLQQALQPYARTQVECADGWQRLHAVLPARERRALVLIDPPYEDGAADLADARAALGTILERQANAIIAVWYPIKDEEAISAWLAGIARSALAPTLAAELWVHPRDSALGLNGSGLVIVNPPWQFDAALSAWQPLLLASLAAAGQGGTSVRWLVSEAVAGQR